jgi:two-component system, NarL family, nitrate/nitrite response regulator NarL
MDAKRIEERRVGSDQMAAVTRARALGDAADVSGRIAVALITDVRLYADGLTQLLDGQCGIHVVATVPPTQVLERLALLHADVVLIDSATAERLGLIRRIRDMLPGLRIVVFAVGESEAELIRCVEAGISGYVGYSGNTGQLIGAIKSAVRGEVLCPPQTVASLFRRIAVLARRTEVSTSDQRLSGREREIVELIDRGLTNKEIAQRLRIGVATVKNHVHNILEKLQVSRRGEAAARLRGRYASLSRDVDAGGVNASPREANPYHPPPEI